MAEPVVRGAVARRVPRPEDAEDVVQDVLLTLARHVGRVRFPDEASAWAWLWCVVRSRHLSFLRAQGRYRRRIVPLEDPGPQASPAGVRHGAAPSPWGPDPLGAVGRESLEAATEGVCALVRRGGPPREHAAAMADEIGTTEEEVRRNIDVMARVRCHGVDCLVVGRDLGYEGADAQVRARVARQATRGALALWHGARLVAPRMGPVHQEFLERLRMRLRG
ncbi:sigma-70 family RNA polymerase sigma factor [Myxococcota bacterium]|nr:sigma-70 family RNA polymerase sigma factor [Myxococcota bacterium]